MTLNLGYDMQNYFCFRAEFEEKISSLLQGLEATLKTVLEKSGTCSMPKQSD